MRAANGLFLLLVATPGVYILIVYVYLVTLEGPGFAADRPGFVQLLFLSLLAASFATLAVVVFTQTSKKFMAERARLNIIGWVFNVFAMGLILSEALTIYGLLITLFSGSIIYVIGFALSTWTCQLVVRTRFKQNLQRIP